MTTHFFGYRPNDEYHVKLIKICEEIVPNYLTDYSIYYNGAHAIINSGLVPFPKLNLLTFAKKKLNEIIKEDPNEYFVIISADYLEDMCGSGPGLRNLKELDKKIILVTAVVNAELDFPDMTNITFVYGGGDHLAEMNRYPDLHPARDKNFDSEQWWLCKSAKARPHRVLVSAALLGQGLGLEHIKTGRVKIDIWEYAMCSTWTDFYPLRTHSATAEQSAILDQGVARLKNKEHFGQPNMCPIDVLSRQAVSTVNNFDQDLRFDYQNAFVEVLNETTFFSKGIFITEKYQQTIFGYVLPIMIGNAGTVAYLRSQGFDMYDDVVDHSYDSIEDPIQRLFSAIDLNRQLLTDRQFAQEQWRKMLPRMDANLEFCKNMYGHYYSMFRQNLTTALENLTKK